MEHLHNYYKYLLNEMLTTTLSISKAQHKITTDIFHINNDEIESDDYIFLAEGKNMILLFMMMKILTEYIHMIKFHQNI